MAQGAKKYYAYRLPDGRKGIADNWPLCEKLVSGKRDARYRGFKSYEEAEEWLHGGARYEVRIKPKLEKGIYFDAGTGRGNGVEVSVTDEEGKDVLHEVLPKTKINKFGKHTVRGAATNNYGELLACLYALQAARKRKVKKVFGDSALVVNFWSRGIMKEKALPQKTRLLVRGVAAAREQFEMHGGTVGHISGDWNPADLGFH
jgi:ribonuclease HI